MHVLGGLKLSSRSTHTHSIVLCVCCCVLFAAIAYPIWRRLDLLLHQLNSAHAAADSHATWPGWWVR